MALDDMGRDERGNIVDWGRYNFKQNEQRAHEAHTPAPAPSQPSGGGGGSSAVSAPSIAGISSTVGGGWNNVAPPVKDAATGQILAVNPQTGRYEALTSPAQYGAFGINANESNVTVVPNAAGLAGMAPGGAVGGGGTPAPGGPSAGGGAATDPLTSALQSAAAGNAQQQAVANAQAAATLAAQQEYQRALVQTANDRLAFERAQQAYKERYEAELLTFEREQETQRITEATRGFGLQEAGVTGTYQGAPTEARLAREQTGALGLLNTAAQLRGPSNYFQYLRTFGNAPQGLLDVVNAVAGRYNLPTAAGATGQGSQPANLQSLIAGLQPQAIAGQQAQAAGATAGLPNPNQLNLANWSRLLPSQQQMVLGAYESGLGPGGAAYTPEDVARLIQQSAPQFRGPSSGQFQF